MFLFILNPTFRTSICSIPSNTKNLSYLRFSLRINTWSFLFWCLPNYQTGVIITYYILKCGMWVQSMESHLPYLLRSVYVLNCGQG